MSGLTSKELWETSWKKKQKIEEFSYSFDLLDKYLPFDTDMKCIEIGCVPGRLMIAFNRMFGYQVSGVDYCNMEETRKNLRDAGVDFKLYREDFDKFKAPEKYDVVSSFGFIEHFENPAVQIGKMTEMLNEGGFLVMGLPNFKYGQYVLHKILDRQKVFDMHNLKIMDLKVIGKIMAGYGLKTLYLGYYKPFQYWHGRKDKLMRAVNFPFLGFSHVVNKFTDRFRLNLCLTNKYLSPYIMYVGRKE